MIKENFLLVGISIKPETEVSEIEEYLKLIDIILIMSVNPGKAGRVLSKTHMKKLKTFPKLERKII